MSKNSYKFFQNKECEYFPCHKNVDVNCLFCFCPLFSYVDCGGNYKLTDKGIKDCSDCKLAHREKGYDYIVGFLKRKYENEKGL